MTTVATDQLTGVIEGLKEAAERALQSEDVQLLCDLEKQVNEVDMIVRELQQAAWADPAKQAIKRLKGKDPLTQADLEVIRVFLVSDAERYLAHENNFGDWKRELSRLMEDLGRRCNMADRNTLGDVRGVLKDAIRLVPDIRNYLEERTRVEKFNNALNNLEPASREMLARLMEEQLRSPRR